MEISVMKEDLKQLNFYIENYFVKSMNDACVSFEGMAFALETLHRAIKEANRTMEEDGDK